MLTAPCIVVLWVVFPPAELSTGTLILGACTDGTLIGECVSTYFAAFAVSPRKYGECAPLAGLYLEPYA